MDKETQNKVMLDVVSAAEALARDHGEARALNERAQELREGAWHRFAASLVCTAVNSGLLRGLLGGLFRGES